MNFQKKDTRTRTRTLTRTRNRKQKATRKYRGGSGLSVKFKGLEAANNLRPRNQTLTPPTISWPAGLADTFTLVMWDPDAPHPSFVHWIVTNIPGSQIHKGTVAVPYMPPSPPSGIHRYYLTLFKQSAPVSVEPIPRDGFSLDAFIGQYGLNKLGQKMIRVAAAKN